MEIPLPATVYSTPAADLLELLYGLGLEPLGATDAPVTSRIPCPIATTSSVPPAGSTNPGPAGRSEAGDRHLQGSSQQTAPPESVYPTPDRTAAVDQASVLTDAGFTQRQSAALSQSFREQTEAINQSIQNAFALRLPDAMDHYL